MTNEEYINQHPEQFKDDIDKWLFTEFGIIGGCCSAEKSHEYSVARMVAERYKKNIVDKACEFIDKKANFYRYHYVGEEHECDMVDTRKFIEDFKKAVKE